MKLIPTIQQIIVVPPLAKIILLGYLQFFVQRSNQMSRPGVQTKSPDKMSRPTDPSDSIKWPSRTPWINDDQMCRNWILFNNNKYWYPLGQRKVILHDSIMTFVSVIPAMVHQNLDSVMVGHGVHSFQTICIMLMAWCCMICLDWRTVYMIY